MPRAMLVVATAMLVAGPLDAAALLRMNRAGLHFGLLTRCVNGLGLTKEWSEVWSEACPGEGMPIQ